MNKIQIYNLSFSKCKIVWKQALVWKDPHSGMRHFKLMRCKLITPHTEAL